ncbi:MAG: HlyD family efflux transporter periplasmic adaptor subunit [Polyangiales bacterium]|nr:HlyD family efflux transporter periplasmic adaptor subunit [Myxococcales bacterium]
MSSRPGHAAVDDGHVAVLLPASRLVPNTTTPVRRARYLALAFAAFLGFAALAPWRQSVSGTGQVFAFLPDERPQVIEATISGRIARWHVVEGQQVEEGELLVELSDNDPDRLARLTLERDAQAERLAAYVEQVTAFRERVEALRQARDAQIAAARAEVRVTTDTLTAQRELLVTAEARVATADIQQARVASLSSDGLASQRERELATLGATDAQASLRSARASVSASEARLRVARSALDRVEASTEADLRAADASLRSAETQVASARASLVQAESRLAQQSAQRVRAPRAGVVQRIMAQQGGAQVSSGATLALLVPRTASRSVQLYVDGNDAALVSPGREVRLQFEGWPAVQFAGWPSVAVGSFAGRVAFVDTSDDGRGDFRVVVVPDPDHEPWPDPTFLRQGTRVKGWLLLEEVTVGFELWRQLNGFPPRYDRAPSTGYEAGSGGAS